MAKKFQIDLMIFARLVNGSAAYVCEGMATLRYSRKERRFELTCGNSIETLDYDTTSVERLKAHWEGFLKNTGALRNE